MCAMNFIDHVNEGHQLSPLPSFTSFCCPIVHFFLFDPLFNLRQFMVIRQWIKNISRKVFLFSYKLKHTILLTQSKSKTIITRSMCVKSLIVLTNKYQRTCYAFILKWFFIAMGIRNDIIKR